jgi:hypothetical protein
VAFAARVAGNFLPLLLHGEAHVFEGLASEGVDARQRFQVSRRTAVKA